VNKEQRTKKDLAAVRDDFGLIWLHEIFFLSEGVRNEK
jgi:hypothetical protein